MGTRVGVVGTGFVSRHFCLSIKKHAGYAVSRVLTRRSAREKGVETIIEFFGTPIVSSLSTEPGGDRRAARI